MYENTIWKDKVIDPTRTYTMTDNGDGTITLVPYGTVEQEGTPLSAANHNNMEEGIAAANVSAAEALRLCNLFQDDIEGVQGITIEATLTNSYSYPFNNSVTTISIPTASTRRNTDYVVLVEIEEYEGGVVGNVTISDKLVNGFKAEFDGSATSVTMKFYVIGGMAE